MYWCALCLQDNHLLAAGKDEDAIVLYDSLNNNNDYNDDDVKVYAFSGNVSRISLAKRMLCPAPNTRRFNGEMLIPSVVYLPSTSFYPPFHPLYHFVRCPCFPVIWSIIFACCCWRPVLQDMQPEYTSVLSQEAIFSSFFL